MKQDDLNNLTQDENNKPDNEEIAKNETSSELNSEKEETVNETEEVKEELIEKKSSVTEPELKEKEAENVVSETKSEKVVEELKESAADLILNKLKNKKLDDVQDVEKTTESSEEDTSQNTELKPDTDNNKSDKLTENKSEVKEKEFERVDYSKLTMDELIQNFSELLEQPDIQKVKDRIELIKVNFYKKHHAKIELDKKKFVDDGGKLEEFKPEEDKLEEKFKAFYSLYREKRAEYGAQQEQNKKLNLEKKYKIIEDIKELINGQESMNKTFHEFKDLQNQWHDAGQVPQTEVKKLWDSYHHWVEKFYDYVKLNKELRDLDLKKNMERKLNLCQKAEELLLEPKVVTAFKILQKLHGLWREIGPVPTEKKDELWERFKKATTTINKNHQDYFEGLKVEQQNNLKAKTLLCGKIEETNELELTTQKEWEENSKEIIELQRLWKLIGFAPKKENNLIYSRFRKACDTFFNKKREFYSKHKEVEENNLQLKIELCIQAESMMDSTDWRKTTDLYIAIQKKWKTIGSVPRKHKDTIWHRFRKACNQFFDNKSAHYQSLDSAQDENLELKKAIVEKIKNFDFSDDGNKNFEKLSKFQNEWTEIGYVPLKNKDEIQSEYRAAIDAVFEKLDIGETEKMKLKFRSKLENIKSAPQSRGRMRNEHEKLYSKLEKLKADIVLWENNIGFFAKSKNAESMIKEFNEKIEKAKATVITLKEQLNMIDDLL